MMAIAAGDSAWLLTSTALVLLMVPGLALFYGGMVRSKNVLSTMMQSMVALAIVGVQWVVFGYALAFGDDVGGWGLVGWNSDYVLLQGVDPTAVWPGTGVPILVHAMFQGMFAVITPALISGALAERIRFGRYCAFVFLWSTFVYAPLAHQVWHPDGWLFVHGALDFAGGTVVHVAAGVSALVAALMLRERVGYPQRPLQPSSAANTLFGAGLLWFGWFGFNAGSALAASSSAALAITVTHVAAAAGALAWVLVEWWSRGKPTAIGFASGAVAGLVGITPAAGFVSPASALLIGAVVSVLCFVAVQSKTRLGYDDSLDAFGIHGIGGALGAILTGVLASKALYDPSGDGGWLIDGNFGQVQIQAVGVLATVAFAAPATWLLVKVLDRGAGFAVAMREEEDGLDEIAHGERAWDLSPDSVTAVPVEPRAAARPPRVLTHVLTVKTGGGESAATRWARLCGEPTPPAEFAQLYPHVARVESDAFRLVGGDVAQCRRLLASLFDGAEVRASAPIGLPEIARAS